MNKKIKIIAEAGVNHNGKKNLAYKLIESAKEANADYVKFQTFSVDNLASKKTRKAPYQRNTKEKSQYEMLKKLELDNKAFIDLFKFSEEQNIEIFSTPFDCDNLNFLCDLGMKRIKISSGEIMNGHLILESSKKRLPIILSTGMCNLKDIEIALGVICIGFLGLKPKKINFQFLNECYKDKYAKEMLKKKVTIMHCTTSYPCPVSETNLLAIKTLQEKFGISVGFSDHTIGNTASSLAVALGADLLEKHFTINKLMKGPDHKTSLNVKELKDYVKYIADVRKYLGSKEKKIQTSEKKNVTVIRKSLYARKKINKGELFSFQNLIYKRPFDGKSPLRYWNLLNKKSKKNYSEGDLI